MPAPRSVALYAVETRSWWHLATVITAQLRFARLHKLGLYGVLLFALLPVSNDALARKSDFSKPIDVSADRSEYDEKAGIQVLIGNVEITQGTMIIKADKIAITLKNNQLSSIEGDGSPIQFQQENEAGELVTGQASSIKYNAENGSLVLTGGAILTQPRQRLQSDRIVFNSTEQKVSAEGGDKGRVSIRIQPPAANK